MLVGREQHIANLIIGRINSEKSTALVGGGFERMVLRLRKEATKEEVSAAVELIYGVKPQKVNILNVKGKVKFIRRKKIKLKDWKKAYVSFQSKEEVAPAKG